MTALLRPISRAILILLAAATVAPAQNLPDLRFTEERWDFGCVGVDFTIYHDFAMVNHGTDTIAIDTVTAHCDCTSVRFNDSTVAPGDTARFRMLFSTANFYGLVEKDIRVRSSDAKVPKLEILYSATVGQWLLSVAPDPVSVFFLPTHKTKISRFVNNVLDEISVAEIEIDKEIVTIKVLEDEASKGEAVELELTASPDLPKGSHTTNFTVTFKVPDDMPPLRITIPVRVVRY